MRYTKKDAHRPIKVNRLKVVDIALFHDGYTFPTGSDYHSRDRVVSISLFGRGAHHFRSATATTLRADLHRRWNHLLHSVHLLQKSCARNG